MYSELTSGIIFIVINPRTCAILISVLDFFFLLKKKTFALVHENKYSMGPSLLSHVSIGCYDLPVVLCIAGLCRGVIVFELNLIGGIQ